MSHTVELEPNSVAVVLGTRPEIIKLAEIIELLGSAAQVIHTGQHYDRTLSEIFIETFALSEPSVHLEVGGKTRGQQIGSAVAALDEFLAEQGPRALIVQGDTNTALAGAIAANALDIPLCHVEAGLRSYDKRMPEEHNRVLVDHISDLLMAPTTVARENLMAEGIGDHLVKITGNTVVGAVQRLLPGRDHRSHLLDVYGLEASRYVLSTFHRPENVDDAETFARILDQLSSLGLPVLMPLHPRSRLRADSHGLGPMLEAINVVDPIGYEDFLALGAEAAFLVSDSGGIQEEVSVYKRPVIVVRRSTERPEVLGTFAELVEPGEEIGKVAASWLEDLPGLHRSLENLASPYGDGSTAHQIVAELKALLSDS